MYCRLTRFLAMPCAAAGVARVCFYGWWVGDLPDPRIALLAAEELPSVVLSVIGSPTGLPIVVVVADEVRRDAGLAQHSRDGVVERLQRTPRAVEKVGPPGVQIAAGGHTRHGADVAGVESERPLGEPLEIGRVCPIAAVGRQHVPVERVSNMTIIAFIHSPRVGVGELADRARIRDRAAQCAAIGTGHARRHRVLGIGLR